jgi:hypothetical protein
MPDVAQHRHRIDPRGAQGGQTASSTCKDLSPVV